MKEQFNHKLLTSFYLWFDNKIVDKGGGFVNKNNVSLKKQTNPSSPMTYSWASPHYQWVWDSGVSGVNYISSVTTTGGQVLTRASGVKFDYVNGRVLSNTNWGDTLTGSYAKKEFNIYMADEDEVDIYLENVFGQNNDVALEQSAPQPNKFVAPCVLLTLTNNYNVPFSFGGEETSKRTIRAFVISDDNFNKEAICSLSEDAAREVLPLVPNSAMPITEYGDVKASGYSYKALTETYPNKDVFISSVESIKVGEKTNKNTNFSLSLLEFDLEINRFPRE